MYCAWCRVTVKLSWDRNCYHFVLSLSQLFSPLLWDEIILTSTARNSSAQRAQLTSAFAVKLVESGEMVDNLKLWPAVLSFFFFFFYCDNKMGLWHSSHRFTRRNYGHRFILVWYKQGREGKMWEGSGVVAAEFVMYLFIFTKWSFWVSQQECFCV